MPFNNFCIIKSIEDSTKKLKESDSQSVSQDMVQHYFILFRFTDQGIRNAKDIPRRAAASRSDAEKIGGKLTLYWTFGEYDGIAMLEAPNDEAAMEFELRLGSLGNVRTTTLRAFNEEEITRVLDKLG